VVIFDGEVNITGDFIGVVCLLTRGWRNRRWNAGLADHARVDHCEALEEIKRGAAEPEKRDEEGDQIPFAARHSGLILPARSRPADSSAFPRDRPTRRSWYCAPPGFKAPKPASSSWLKTLARPPASL